MKKVLFGTTALMAVAAYTTVAMAEPITLKIGGKQEAWFGIADVDDGDASAWGGTGLATDTEVYFSGKTTLDNGLTVKAVIQLEADTTSTGNADETYMILSGGFGALQLGARQGAIGNMTWHGVEFGGQDWDEAYYSSKWSPTPSDFALDSNTSYTYYSDDDASIAYTSPEFFGFSVGATYVPEVGGIGLSDYNDSSTGLKDRFDAVIAYNNEFSGVGVHADFGYMYGFGTTAVDSYEMYRVGAELSYAGFALGGAWADHDYDGDTTTSEDGNAWMIGAGYENGPYGVDFNYSHANAEGTLGDDEDETSDYYKVSGRYDLGPGIALSASIYHVNYDNDGADQDVSVTGGLMGVALKF